MTTYRWFYADGGEVEPEYVISHGNGTFTLNDELVGQWVSCEMSNDYFPGLTQRTENVLVEFNVVLETPENLRVTKTAQTTLSLQWNPVADAVEYVLQRKGPGDSDFVTIYIGSSSKYVDTALAEDTEYEYRVRATGSAFSEAITVATAPGVVDGKPVVDSPAILETISEPDGRTTIRWTDLGPEYVYTVYKAGRIVVAFDGASAANAYYTDENPSASGVEGYAIIAYNTVLRQYSTLVTTVVHTTAPPVEITSHEELPSGGIKLTWDVEPGMIYSVFRAGLDISAPHYITSGEWVDENPQAVNDYMLVAIYTDGATRKATFSNLYTVKRTVPFSALNVFWGEYDGGIIEE